MENEFRFFNLGLPARFVLSGGLYVLGAFLELAFPQARGIGWAVIAAGWFPLMLRSATNAPDDQGLEEWRLVAMADIDRLDDSLRATRKVRRGLGSPAKTLPLHRRGAGLHFHSLYRICERKGGTWSSSRATLFSSSFPPSSLGGSRSSSPRR